MSDMSVTNPGISVTDAKVSGVEKGEETIQLSEGFGSIRI
jgi:hypothetical protein